MAALYRLETLTDGYVLVVVADGLAGRRGQGGRQGEFFRVFVETLESGESGGVVRLEVGRVRVSCYLGA